jgi:AcrR family transcriptional regulator
MPSTSSRSVRVEPQQERSTKRLAGFLEAAAELFGAVGFEAATMQAIADRGGSSIGALYNYFPDKDSVAATIRGQYAEELRARLKALAETAEKLSIPEFADGFIDCIATFVRERPAWLALYAGPFRFRRDPIARKALRSALANTLREKNAALSPERALLVAHVVIQIVKGMMTLYLESEPKARNQVQTEFRDVLASYLEKILSEQPSGA